LRKDKPLKANFREFLFHALRCIKPPRDRLLDAKDFAQIL
jgi:hypothetical protein